MKPIMRNKGLVTVGTFILTSLFVLWEYLNGGVITHHLLAREDLPGVSNWWGLLTVPLLAWSTISLINKRLNRRTRSETKNLKNQDAEILKHFLAALVFGIVASLLWEFNLADILRYFILLPILIAFFRPVHLPEYLFGFVIGMLFTFGGILPILIGTILLVLCFLINKLTRTVKNFLIKS